MRRYSLLFLAIVILLLPLSRAAAQVENPGQSTGGGYGEAAGPASLGHPGTDEAYVENGLRLTNVGVVFSRLAQQKASSSEVRSFAKNAADTHLSIGAGLLQSAKALDLKAPAGLGPKYDAEFKELQKLSGPEFDKQYLETLIRMQHDEYSVMQGEFGPGGTKRDNFKMQSQKDADDLARLTDQAAKLQKKIGKS